MRQSGRRVPDPQELPHPGSADAPDQRNRPRRLRALSGDANALREALLAEAAPLPQKTPEPGAPGRGAIPVDHSFNVKGIGTVVPGSVATGTIRKHDTLQALPTEKTPRVRSIEKHDDDADSAVTGNRVGLALKGIEAEELDRGFVLTNDPGLKLTSAFAAEPELVKYWTLPLKKGMVMYLGHWMQLLPARIESMEEGGNNGKPKVTIRLDKVIVHPPGAGAVPHTIPREEISG